MDMEVGEVAKAPYKEAKWPEELLDEAALENEKATAEKARRTAVIRYVQAVFCVLGMIVTWVAMSELLQSLSVGHFFMTWYIHCLYIIYFAPAGFLFWWRKRTAQALIRQGRLDVEQVTFRNPGYGIKPKAFIILGVILSFLLFIVGWLWYVSLPITTVAANNSIYQSISVFVFIFSVWLVREKVTIQKLFAVAVSVVGLVLVAIAPERTDNKGHSPTPVGYIWVIGSTILYGLYEVLYKRYMENEGVEEEHLEGSFATESTGTLPTIDRDMTDPGSIGTEDSLNHTGSTTEVLLDDDGLMENGRSNAPKEPTGILLQLEASMLMLSTIGFFTLTLMWPIFPLFNATKVEIWEWPSASKLEELTANAIMDGTYNLLLLYGIMLSSPLFMSVGTMLVVPVSIFVDHFVHGTKLSPEAILGVCFIVLGFICLNFPITKSKLKVVSKTLYQRN